MMQGFFDDDDMDPFGAFPGFGGPFGGYELVDASKS